MTLYLKFRVPSERDPENMNGMRKVTSRKLVLASLAVFAAPAYEQTPAGTDFFDSRSYAGRDFRLTDVYGEVVRDILV